MNALKAIKELVKKNFSAILSNEEAGELLLLFSYEIEVNPQTIGRQEIFRNTFEKYLRQRKMSFSYN